MMTFTILDSLCKRVMFFSAIAAVALLTLAAGLHYATPLAGLPRSEIKEIGSGWSYEDSGSLHTLSQFPCPVDVPGDTLYLVHSVSDLSRNPGDVLAVQTRYQSIRIWADQMLIYEAAQGREHALSSMWHFISSDTYQGASTLRIELIRYDTNSPWELFPIFQDHPAAIGMYLHRIHLPTIFVWLCCTLFVVLLSFIILFMAVRKIAGISPVLALDIFIFMSGTWILLDSKITTLFGGNFALTYFFSYFIFYLLPVPLLFYFQLMLETKIRFVRALIWIAVGNAGLWMLLHLLGIVAIRSTAVSVHLIIILFLIIFIKEFIQQQKQPQQKRLVCTFWGMLLIFAAAAASILLYHAGLLPSTNSGVLYIWALLALIFCMIMDTIIKFGRMWNEKKYIEVYRQLATEDSMTKLSNRNAYELRLQDLISHPPATVGMILFDIDRMKFINDTYGHHTGDLVISLVARCIYQVFGTIGECYRIGGDEFCVILAPFTDVSQKFQQFHTLLQTSNHNDFPVNVSYGWEVRSFEAGKPITFREIMELKTAADKNLYRNKRVHSS